MGGGCWHAGGGSWCLQVQARLHACTPHSLITRPWPVVASAMMAWPGISGFEPRAEGTR